MVSSCTSIQAQQPNTQINKETDIGVFTSNTKQNKENSMINVKIEENNSEMPKIRKKICRKMLKIFHDEFNLDRKDAKRLTLHLESRFNLLFSFKSENYINTIKKFFTNLRVNFLFFCFLIQK